MIEPRKEGEDFLKNFTRSDFKDQLEYNRFKQYRATLKRTNNLSSGIWAVIYIKLGYSMNWTKND